MNGSWYAVKNVKNDSAEISIFDEIGFFGITAKEFANELKGLGKKRITLRIHSPGGEIFDGHAIYNALRRHPGGVDVAIDGLAASMASVIAMVGEKRSMAENGMIMIHNPWTLSMGEADDLRNSADLLDTLKQTVISAYEGRTGLDRGKLSSMMDDETWMNAKDALEMGFITEITEPLNMRNSFEGFDISQFSKRPRNFMSDKPESKLEAIVEAPNAVETPEAKLEISEEEAAVISLKAEAALVPGLKAEIVAYKEENANLVKEVEAKSEELQKLSLSYDRLKKSLAISPASEIVRTPTVAAAKSHFEIWSEMPSNTSAEAEAKGSYYRQHRAEIQPFANKSAVTSSNL